MLHQAKVQKTFTSTANHSPFQRQTAFWKLEQEMIISEFLGIDQSFVFIILNFDPTL